MGKSVHCGKKKVAGNRRERADYGNWEAVESVTEILENILSRLPVKTLLICKSVSKHWYRLISTPVFTKLQLSRSKRNMNYIIFPHVDGDDVVRSMILMEKNWELGELINLPGLEALCGPDMICSVDGLVCYTNDVSPSLEMVDLEIRICNPATQEVLLLPKGSPSPLSSLGLAFDPENKEYNVYHFFLNLSNSEEEHFACEVYSSKTGSWRAIGRVGFYPMVNTYCIYMSDHLYVGGKVYWFTSLEESLETPGSIISVDKNDTFRKISLPCEASVWSFLIDLNGSLALVTLDETERNIAIWSLEDGDMNVWSLKAVGELDLGEKAIARFDTVVAIKSDILFIIRDCCDSYHYLQYNVDIRDWMPPPLDLVTQLGGLIPVVFPFTESLLPCSGGLGQ